MGGELGLEGVAQGCLQDGSGWWRTTGEGIVCWGQSQGNEGAVGAQHCVGDPAREAASCAESGGFISMSCHHVFKNPGLGAGVVGQWVKLPLSTWTSRITVPVQVPAARLWILFFVNALRRQRVMVPATHTWEIRMEFLAPGFSLGGFHL